MFLEHYEPTEFDGLSLDVLLTDMLTDKKTIY